MAPCSFVHTAHGSLYFCNARVQPPGGCHSHCCVLLDDWHSSACNYAMPQCKRKVPWRLSLPLICSGTVLHSYTMDYDANVSWNKSVFCRLSCCGVTPSSCSSISNQSHCPSSTAIRRARCLQSWPICWGGSLASPPQVTPPPSPWMKWQPTLRAWQKRWVWWAYSEWEEHQF